MKKGFTMIELIFVIVILGILASVAIPRLAATREDAEISAAVANLRTLVSDISAYYAVKGSFDAGADGKSSTIKWSEITNVPMKDPNGVITKDGVLVIDNQECIKFTLRDKGGTNALAHFVIAKGKDATGVCKQVQDAAPLQAYFNSKATGVTINNGAGSIAIGSSTSIYDE
ncbi:MAG: prepilin-type N-terminal cleavage/methylation domain-containing protein [Campylobacter sp.]|uniref:type II secretion system protein n=1 Tax=Campylobacter sp. TaxID=205 RepID=UPI002AA914CA|nr:type II secretion system protein [Campylobacter sp.]MCI6344227.1 prepilin-type N-terminal cleavage/methylation domain-containing protein [Campylobacter sp.]